MLQRIGEAAGRDAIAHARQCTISMKEQVAKNFPLLPGAFGAKYCTIVAQDLNYCITVASAIPFTLIPPPQMIV